MGKKEKWYFFKITIKPLVCSDKYPNISWLEADESDDNRSSGDYQYCDVSKFYISDMIVLDFTFGGTTFNDTSESNCFANNKHPEPNMLLGVAEQFRVLPLLEDSIRSSRANDEKSDEQAMMDPISNPIHCPRKLQEGSL